MPRSIDEELPYQVGEDDSVSRQANTWAALAHASSLVGFVFPFGHLLAPLVIWLIKRDESPLIDDQGKESLNFQLTMSIYFALAFALCFLFIGFLLLPVLLVVDVVCVLIATMKASGGVAYRYPLTIRLLN